MTIKRSAKFPVKGYSIQSDSKAYMHSSAACRSGASSAGHTQPAPSGRANKQLIILPSLRIALCRSTAVERHGLLQRVPPHVLTFLHRNLEISALVYPLVQR